MVKSSDNVHMVLMCFSCILNPGVSHFEIFRFTKFNEETNSIKIGVRFAILKNELLPPLQWPLVRITEIHPGRDGIVRAVTVRNSAGQLFSRPVVKLAFLPTPEDENQDTAV